MNITKQHDLGLGKWGPYNKEYLGVCHIANEELGATFCVELFPAFYRRRIVKASALSDGDVRMWGANASRTAFVYRYELEWKDKVYVDAHFNITDDKLVNIDCEIVNNTAREQSVNLFLSLGMAYPAEGINAVRLGNKKISEAVLEDGCFFIDALDYSDISCAEKLAQDGKFLGEAEAPLATGKGTLVSGAKFFASEHFLKYEIGALADSVGIRYKTKEDTELEVDIDGEIFLLSLPACDGFGYATLEFPCKKIDQLTLRPSGYGVDVDCIIYGCGATRVKFSHKKYVFSPISKIEGQNSMTLRYADTELDYVVEWDREALMLRTLHTDDVGNLLNKTIHDHVQRVRYDGKPSEGVYEIIRTSPVYLKPNSKEKMSFVIRSVERDADTPVSRKESEIYRVESNSDGKRYEFSQNMMAYNTLLNVVYPIYTRRGYIRHSAPGRIWNCLYTWDSGFIGMGLSTVDYKSAYENLRAYLTPLGDKHSPYIFHGSVVPTQFFLYLELVNKYPEKKEELARLYPMMMQYYRFFSDMSEDKNQMKSGLLKTWHIFYNSGGWDDYPPQKFVRYSTADVAERHNAGVTPVITTSLAVLIAKIMKNISRVLGISENNSLFERDIERYSRAIQENAWDEEAGYYSYVVHDENGLPKEHLRYSDGTNYNMGLDGAYPYIAGISDAHQSKKILENIKRGMMTKYGVGVVDTRAPYYTPYGYWNGSVWMPHQWILMKSLLDTGEVEFAAKIAKTALSVWKREVDDTYLCFEHFMSENGRGAGFHQFSGLSTPVLMFFEMLYKPGAVTCGFGAAISEKSVNADKTSARIKAVSEPHGAYIIICLNEKCKYKFTVNKKPVRSKRLTLGAYAIPLGCAGEKIIECVPV